jgi:hypothetical protein
LCSIHRPAYEENRSHQESDSESEQSPDDFARIAKRLDG